MAETNDQRFTGKAGFVTGAGTGVGRATAPAFAAEGASLAIAGIPESDISDTAHGMDPGTWQTASECRRVGPVPAVLPWRYVFAHCVTKRGDRGRLDRARPAEGQL